MSAARQKASAEVSRINAEIDRRVVAGGEGGVVSGTVGGVVGVGVGGRALRSKLGAGVLPGGVILEREDGVRVSVTEVILYCGDHLGKYFCDPLYPEKGRKKAQIFWNKENDASSRFVLSSFVGGGCVYTLEPDAGEVLRILKGLAESGPRGKEIVGAAMEEKDWWVTEFGRLDQVGLDSVIAYIGSLRLGGGVGGKTELRNRVAAASSVDKELEVWRDREAVLEELNKRFAYVAIGGKPAYVEYREDSREWVIRDRNGFLAELEGEPKVCKVGAGGWDGKMKFEPLALAWLEWKGRRSYDDFIFNPAVDKREYVEKGTGRRVLNKFRGFSVKPARSEEFACGKVGCGGLGCLKWFFGPGGGGLCSAESAGEVCGWTYWLKTILDVAAAGDMQGARWIVDWFADILRNPGGRDGGRAREKRSGVCLTLKGGMGTGKDSIVEPIMKLLAPHSWELAEMDRFTAKHNTYMEGNLLMHGAEVMWGGSQKEGNRLKQIITGEEITIEPKYYAPYSVTNYCRYFFSTNADWSVPAGHDERRHTVFQVTDAHKQDRAWFAKVKAGRLEELLAMLLDFEPEMDVFTFFHTAELDEQKQMSAPMELEFVELVWDSDIYFDGAGVGRAVAYTQIAADFQSMFGPRRTLKTAEQFKRGFNKLLKTHGYYDAINRKVKVGKGYVNGLTMPSRDWWKEEFPFMGFC